MHVVKIACERPDELGRSLSQWDCTEIARQLVRDGVVTYDLGGDRAADPAAPPSQAVAAEDVAVGQGAA